MTIYHILQLLGVSHSSVYFCTPLHLHLRLGISLSST
jgi:hypothetical protein